MVDKSYTFAVFTRVNGVDFRTFPYLPPVYPQLYTLVHTAILHVLVVYQMLKYFQQPA